MEDAERHQPEESTGTDAYGYENGAGAGAPLDGGGYENPGYWYGYGGGYADGGNVG